MELHDYIKRRSPIFIYSSEEFVSLFTQKIVTSPVRYLLFTDRHIWKLWGEELHRQCEQSLFRTIDVLLVPQGEQSKTRECKQQLEDQLFQHGVGREACFLALGGGAILDLIGFLGSTYCRGVPVLYLPTTYLAAVDSCVGGKTAVNTSYGKNLIGTFSLPESVWINISYFSTLPIEEILYGMVEVIKKSLIADALLFEKIESTWEQVIAKESPSLPALLEEFLITALQIKISLVESDLQDRGKRQWLNFGHTIAHVLEQGSNYQIPHGAAVALGIIGESFLSHQRAGLSRESLQRIIALLSNSLLFSSLKKITLSWEEAKKILLRDKKRLLQEGSEISAHSVLIERIGKAKRENRCYTFSFTFEEWYEAFFFLASHAKNKIILSV